MKFLTSVTMAAYTSVRGGALRPLLRLAVIIAVTIALFSFAFHEIMALEGRTFSWLSSVYWTLVTMSTLGFGDIVFESDLGRMFSILVLLSGAVLILVMLPFTFIQLVYLPWQAATREAQAPRSLPTDTRDHLLVTGTHPAADELIRRAKVAGMDHAVIVDTVDEALALRDVGYKVMVGAFDDPQTYRAARADQAALVFAARSDQANTNIAFTLREVAPTTLLVTTADSPDAIDVLELAGVNHVLHLGDALGKAFARRILAPTAQCSRISEFEDLVIAEASAAGTPLVGKQLRQLDLRARFGVSVVGVWNRGTLAPPRPDTEIEDRSILLLAGQADQLRAYDAAYAEDHRDDPPTGALAPVVILGGGRVGRAAARALADAGITSRIVERDPQKPRATMADYVDGDAADRKVLDQAGIADTPAVVVTTHDDDVNVFLTLYVRKLRPDVELLARATQARNLETMHRAGADFVLSYGSTGAIEVWNTLRNDSTLLLAEGLVVFRVPVPAALVGKALRDTAIPEDTGCSVIAVRSNGAFRTDLDLDAPLPRDGELVLIGDDDAEDRFVEHYVAAPSRRRLPWRR